MAHTPGPWHVVHNKMRDDDTWFVVRERTASEKEAYPGQLPPGICGMGIRQDDARLIAAAPELLSALKAILSTRPEMWGDCVTGGKIGYAIEAEALHAADAALAKAEGR